MSAREKYAQYITVTQGVQATANDAISTEVSLPIIRLQTTSQATIIEILKVNVCPHGPVGTIGGDETFAFAISTAEPDLTSDITVFQDPTTIWFRKDYLALLTSGAAPFTFTELDLTDGDGHGKLVATDSFYLYFDTTGAAAAAVYTVTWKIWYRFVSVKLVEYLGIVQSQQ